MTIEELRNEADKLGYKLVKKPAPMPKKLDCSCGNKARNVQEWIKPSSMSSGSGYFLKCNKCGLCGGVGKNKMETINLWNIAVQQSKFNQAITLGIGEQNDINRYRNA